jgi:alpha-L-fucosidase 2
MIGNGKLGGAVHGGVQTEQVWLNEDSIWRVNFLNRVNSQAKGGMKQLQGNISSNKLQAAASYASQIFPGNPNGCAAYDQLGSMVITMTQGNSTSSYERYLDISDATSGIYYVVNGVSYFCKYIASYPANLLAIRIASSSAGAVSFGVTMSPGYTSASASGGNSIYMSQSGSTAAGGSMGYGAGTKVITSGGSLSASGSKVTVSGATEACLD